MECLTVIHLTLVDPGGRSAVAAFGIGSDCFPSSSWIRTSNRSHSVGPERLEVVPQAHECTAAAGVWQIW